MPLAILISLAAAIIPTLIYSFVVYLADRYEREPLWLLSAAFLWGALPAILASLIGSFLIGDSFTPAPPGSVTAALVEGSIVTPFVEEVAKAMALFAIFVWARREFDDVLDGVVYGAMIGFGFAMTENLLYFIGAFNSGGYRTLTTVIFLRTVLFGFNHAMYTSLTGIGLGLARNTPNIPLGIFYTICGLLAAIVAHGLHNFGVTITILQSVNILFSVAIAMVGIALLLAVLRLSWQREREIFRVQLANEVDQTLSALEYQVITTRWWRPLLRQKGEAQRSIDRLQLIAELALRKERLYNLGPQREPELPLHIAALRSQLRNL